MSYKEYRCNKCGKIKVSKDKGKTWKYWGLLNDCRKQGEKCEWKLVAEELP